MRYFLCLSVFLISCASVKPLKEDNFKVPKELGEKIEEKFEVTEISKPVIANSKKPIKKFGISEFSKKTIKPTIINKDLISLNEKQELKVYFKGLDAGRVFFQTLGIKEINKKPMYHFRANVYNQPFFYSLYPINELADSFVDVETFTSFRFQLKAKEGKKQKEVLNLIDYELNTMKLYEKENNKVTVNKDLKIEEENIQDLLSVFFYARIVNYSEYKNVKLRVLSKDKVRDVLINYLKSETIPSVLSKETKTLKLSLKIEGKPYEYFIWLSDDEKRAIVRAESEVKVGKVKIELLKYEKSN